MAANANRIARQVRRAEDRQDPAQIQGMANEAIRARDLQPLACGARPDAGELERVESPGPTAQSARARRFELRMEESEGSELRETPRRRCRARAADKDQEQAGDPYVGRPQQAFGADSSQPPPCPTVARARCDGAQKPRRSARRTARAANRERRHASEPDDVPPGREGQRAHEHQPPARQKHVPQSGR